VPPARLKGARSREEPIIDLSNAEIVAAESGSGKDHPLSAAEDLMRSCGMAALLGLQTFASAPGFL